MIRLVALHPHQIDLKTKQPVGVSSTVEGPKRKNLILGYDSVKRYMFSV